MLPLTCSLFWHLPSHSGASNMMIFFVHPVQLLTLPDHSTQRYSTFWNTEWYFLRYVGTAVFPIVSLLLLRTVLRLCLLKAFPSRRILYKIDVPRRAAAFAEQVFFNSLHSSRVRGLKILLQAIWMSRIVSYQQQTICNSVLNVPRIIKLLRQLIRIS